MALTGNAPYEVTFTDTSTPTGEITAWSWNFGDGNTSTDQNPVHTYSTPGAYTVSLNVASDKGTDLETDTVTVYEQADDATILSTLWISVPPLLNCRVFLSDPVDDNLAGYYCSLTDATPAGAEVYKAKSGTGTTYIDVSFTAPDVPAGGTVYTVNVQSVNVHSLRSLNVVTDTTTSP